MTNIKTRQAFKLILNIQTYQTLKHDKYSDMIDIQPLQTFKHDKHSKQFVIFKRIKH